MLQHIQRSDVVAERVAILVGEESSGLPADLVERSDVRVTIQTAGATESLNVAVAAGIVIHELADRKGKPGAGV